MSAQSATAPASVVAVIPVYNESGTIADIARRTRSHVDRVIVVDDGSTDGSPDALNDIDAEIIRLPQNLGKGEALMRGIEAARDMKAEFIVTLDADGQHPPERIPDFLRQLDLNRILVGARTAEPGTVPLARLRANRVANFFISWAAGHWIPDTQCGFRVYPARLFDTIQLRRRRRSGFVFESEILIEACRNGFRVTPIAIPALYDSVLQRPSHFRPVFDIAAIVIMVAAKLLARGFCPRSYAQCRRERRQLETRSCIQTSDAAL